MSWMVGKSGYTFPKDRLNLGCRPNINIHTEKTYNNYGTGYPGGMFPMPMNYNTGFYGNMYGPGYYQDPGLTKGEKWMLGLGAVTSVVGAVTSAITGTKSSEVKETDTSEKVQTKTEQPEKTEQQRRAEMLHQKALEDNQKLKEEAKKLEELRQEGITKNTDGSYTAKFKDAAGNNVTLTNTSLEQLRKDIKAKKEETSQVTDEEDPAELAKEGITKNADGTYEAEVTNKDGKKVILKNKDLFELRSQIMLTEADNLIA